MAYYAGEGGSRTTGTSYSSRSVPSARAGGVPITRLDDLDTLIAEAQSGLTGAFPDQAKLAYLNNLNYIKGYIPDNDWDNKKSGEIDWTKLGELLFDIVGYGGALASVIPYPTTRYGGRILSATSRAARAAIFGSGTRGFGKNLAGPLRELDNATRQYQRYIKKNKKHTVR